MPLNENKPDTKYKIFKMSARQDLNGEFVANPLIVVDGIFEKFNIFANKGKSRPIVIKRLDPK